MLGCWYFNLIMPRSRKLALITRLHNFINDLSYGVLEKLYSTDYSKFVGLCWVDTQHGNRSIRGSSDRN